MLSVAVVLADFVAGFVGGFIGGFIRSFLSAAMHVVVPDWLTVLCILACAALGGFVLGRWRRGPLPLQMTIGSVAYLALNTLVLFKTTPVATILAGGGLVVLSSGLAWFLASRRRRQAAWADATVPGEAPVGRVPLPLWQRVVFGIGGLAMLVSGLTTLYGQYAGSGRTVIMAGCGEDRVTDVVKTIVQQKTGVTLTKVDDITTVSTNSAKAVCTAMLTLSNGEAGRMGYDITIVDDHYQVLMTGLVKAP